MLRLAALLGTITLISGLTPIAARLAVEEFPPLTAAWLRFGIAGILLWITLRLRGRGLSFVRHELRILIPLAILCVPVNQLGYLVGIKLANASHAGLLYALTPVVVFWIALAARETTYSRLMLLAALMAAAGAACVIWPSQGTVGRSTSATWMLLGDLLLLLAVCSWSAFAVLSKPLLLRYGSMSTLTAVFLLGTLLQTPLAFIDVDQLDISRITWRGLTGFGFITLITGFINFLLTYLVLARFEATRAMIVINGNFIITIVTEYALYGEPLTPGLVPGSALIVAAILIDWLRKTQSGPEAHGEPLNPASVGRSSSASP